jgi:hypothetical protein
MKTNKFRKLRPWTLNWIDILQRKKHYIFSAIDENDKRINKLISKLIHRG